MPGTTTLTLTYYLLGGTAYYTLFKSIIGSAPIAKGFPDTDP